MPASHRRPKSAIATSSTPCSASCATIAGLTVLIYDQTCAAEKRRRRKRGLYPDPPKRVFINDAVCEGCGDCSDKSNCISVQPVETEFGRKRRIDQSSCNKDFSCLKGFCPSFVTVRGGTLRKLAGRRGGDDDDAIRSIWPSRSCQPLDRPYGILITGIGGTGVITLGALLGMAAHLEGKGCTVLDFTGLAQKNGAVMSHVRLAPKPRIFTPCASPPAAPICCSAATWWWRRRRPRSRASSRRHQGRGQQPRAADPGFHLQSGRRFRGAAMLQAIKAAAGDGGADIVDGTGLASALMGDSIATNLFMLGYAFQKGLVPLSLAAHRARHRAQRRRGREQQAQLHLGPPRRRRSRAGRGAGAQRAAARTRLPNRRVSMR